MRILIVDDHPIVASGCRAVLAGEPEIVLLEASDAESGERVFATEHPDISVIDINLPTVSGFELARRILARTPSARIIMFSMNDDPVFAARAIDIGAKAMSRRPAIPWTSSRPSVRSARARPICRPRWREASPSQDLRSRRARCPSSPRARWRSCACSARGKVSPRLRG